MTFGYECAKRVEEEAGRAGMHVEGFVTGSADGSKCLLRLRGAHGDDNGEGNGASAKKVKVTACHCCHRCSRSVRRS